jgi:hypothetical protein
MPFRNWKTQTWLTAYVPSSPDGRSGSVARFDPPPPRTTSDNTARSVQRASRGLSGPFYLL